VKSQVHLLRPSSHNPKPTMVPPPIEGLSGHHIRHRVVLAVIGLPLRGQAFIAHRLRHYLNFFHGAQSELFNVNDYLGPNGDEELLQAIRHHFEDADSHHSQKHAIIYTTNALQAADAKWSGHSKSRRRWMKNALEAELGAELHLVEIQVNEELEHNLLYVKRHHLAEEFGDADALQAHLQAFRRRFVTIQEDGTEDYLQYIKVVDYNKKVVTNDMMQTFLGSRVARFLGNVHPYHHTVYLSRIGESEYVALNKIGGDSQLSERGQNFALRLAEFADAVIDKQAKSFACVSLDAAKVKSLRKRLAVSGSNVVAVGSWEDTVAGGIDDEINGGKVHKGMRLTRLLRDGADTFEDAPSTVDGVLEMVGNQPVTLVFSEPSDPDSYTPVCARLWTSALQRANQSVAYIKHPVIRVEDGKVWEQLSHREYRNLNEQYAGEYEGLTVEEIAIRQPEEAELRAKDKLGYRYPRGESYYDVIARLDDSIQMLESYQEPVVIVAHLPVLRLLYAYMLGIPREQAPDLKIQDHTVIQLQFDGTWKLGEKRYFLGPELTPQ